MNNTKLIATFGTGISPRRSINIIRNLQLQFTNYWKLGVDSSPKLEFYRSVKHVFSREKYLKLKNFDYRRALSKIRFSAHNFEIERGRYTTPITPRDERFCKYCDLVRNIKVTECERHILCDCPLYNPLRDRSNLTTNDLIIEIIRNSENHSLTDEVGRLCSSIIDVHQAYTTTLSIMNENDCAPNNNRCKIL